jgi:hypothetical protein
MFFMTMRHKIERKVVVKFLSYLLKVSSHSMSQVTSARADDSDLEEMCPGLGKTRSVTEHIHQRTRRATAFT